MTVQYTLTSLTYLSCVFIVDQPCLACELLQINPPHPPDTHPIHDEVGLEVHSVGFFVKVDTVWGGPPVRGFVVT